MEVQMMRVLLRRVLALLSLRVPRNATEMQLTGKMIVKKKKHSLSASIGKEGLAPKSLVNSSSLPESASIGREGMAPKRQVTRSLLPEILNKKKCSRSSNIGREQEGFPPSSQVSMPTVDRAGYTFQAQMRRFRSPAENVMVHSGKTIPASSGQPAQAQSGQRVPTESGQHVPSESGQRVPSQSGQQHIRAHSEHVTGKRIQAHTQQSFRAQSQSRPDQLQMRVPSQPILQSPTQSRKRTSQSGQSTPNESLQQFTAQSHQHTPEPQSRQHPSDAQSEPNEHTPTPSHPSTLNISSTAANGNLCWNIGFAQRDGRVRVEVIDGTLEPSNKCSAKIREIMYEQLEPTGYNWKSVSKATKNFYFEEFKKYFVWRQEEAIIYKGWKVNAGKKYSELVCVARSDWQNHSRRDNRIGELVHLSWVDFWRTLNFQKRSLIQKRNRRSGVDGRPSTHTSGSASHRTVAARLKLQLKHEPTADELFYHTHTRRLKKKKVPIGDAEENDMNDEDDDEDDGDGEIVWIDKKSQQIYETFLQLCEQKEKYGEPVDRNALFLEAVGGPDKKNRMYGVGSSHSIFYKPKTMPYPSSFASEEENQKLKQQLTEMNERMKAMENQLAMIIETNSVRLPHSPANDDN